MRFIYSPCRDVSEAKRLGRAVLEKKLAACVNVWPIESLYPEGDGIKEGKEVVLLVKTIETHTSEVRRFIEREHSYDTPFVGEIDVEHVGQAYQEWVAKVMG